MTKKMTPEQNNVYNKAVRYLDIIVLASKTINLLREDSTFQAIFSESVSIVNYFENDFNIVNGNTYRYLQAYYTICNKQLKVNDDINNFKNVVEMEDKVNYLNTYLINRLNTSIDELAESFKVNKDVAIENAVVVENVEEVQDNNSNNNHHTGMPISDEEVLQKSGYTVHDVADQLIRTQASILLQRNINKGKVFIYKTKPPIIYVIKMITFVSFILLAILSFTSYIMLMTQAGKIMYPFVTTNPDNNSSDPKIMGLSFTNPFPYIQILIILMIGLILASLIRNIKNDNAKYFMSWGWVAFYAVFILIITMTAGETRSLLFGWDTFISKVKDHNIGPVNGWNQTAYSAIQVLEAWKILQYCYYGLIGVIAICTITAIVFNPKKDIDRVNQLLEQYAREIRNGEIDTSDLGGSPLGGFNGRMI